MIPSTCPNNKGIGLPLSLAEAFAVNSHVSGAVGNACLGGVLVDTDAPYTQAGQQYLSTTAGDITATRPTGANNLVQVLGVALSTTELQLAIRFPYEFHVSLAPLGDGASAAIQNLDYTGFSLEATSEAVGYTVMVPQNAISLEIAYLWWTTPAGGATLDGTDTYTIDVSAGVDDETVTATEDGIAAAALTVAADDLNRADVSAAFNTAGIVQPGNIMGIDVDKAVEGSACDDPVMLTCHLVFLCV